MAIEVVVETESPTMLLQRLQTSLRQFQSSGKAFQLVNPSTASPSTTPRRCRTLIVLDSSFNPPTIAHMQMATSALQDLRAQRDIVATLKGGEAAEHARRYGGHEDDGVRLLLLLAVNNADKEPKPASFEQRLLLMRYFAGDIQRAWRAARPSQQQAPAQEQSHESHESHESQDEDELPVDIGLTTHPYFHEKSAAIVSSSEYDFSSSPAATTPATEQIFLAGYDTLIRIFNPKYYCSPADQTPMQTALDPFFARSRLRITMRTDADWGGHAEQLRYVERLVSGDELDRVGGRREWAKRVEMVEATEGKERDKSLVAVSSTQARTAVQEKSWERLRRLVPVDVAGSIERGEVSW